jgi:hypothetical protein
MGFTQQMRINALVAAGEASRRRAAAAQQQPDMAAAASRFVAYLNDRSDTDATTD